MAICRMRSEPRHQLETGTSFRFVPLFISAILISTSAVADNTAWTFESQADPMTDAPMVMASTEGDAGASAVFGCPAPHRATWILTSSRFDLQFDTTRRVQFRLDSAPPETMIWRNASKGGVALLGDPAAKLAKRVATARNRLVFDDGSGSVVFSLEGAAEAINKALALCQVK